jgi:DNA mismatch repair protein MutS
VGREAAAGWGLMVKRAVQQSDGALQQARAKGGEKGGGDVTPSMAQYLEIKAANPDCILWYRMGDFYELFFEDAVVASEALSIVLTKRGKHLGEDIPMCGVPVHRADEYLQRLIRQGFRVAVCEQLEDPAEARKRGSKAVVKRDVVRLVTPGTLTEEALLEDKARNYLTSLTLDRSQGGRGGSDQATFALASLDISTGEFEIGCASRADLAGELVRLSPGEIIAADDLLADADLKPLLALSGAATTPVAAQSFDSLSGERALLERLGVGDLAAFGAFTRAELAAASALLKYVELTQIGRQSVLRPPRRTGASDLLRIDAASRASLEIVRSTTGQLAGSLLAAIDRTVTGPGARELAARLSSPLADPIRIGERLDAVQYFAEREKLREDVRLALRGAPDIARAVSRLALHRGGPKDLAAVRDGLLRAQTVRSLIDKAADALGPPAEIAGILDRLAECDSALCEKLAAALVETPPHLPRDGGFIRSDYTADLDRARALGEDSRRVMAELEQRYIGDTGIKTLRIRHNNILGYFIEVSANASRPLLQPPNDAVFTHRQTMANAVRFNTAELSETEGQIATAAERALAIEQEIFAELTADVLRAEAALANVATALADVDVHAALGELAALDDYVRPIVDESTAFQIRGGRHPVVEQALRKARSGPFIENDCVLGPAPAREDGGRPPGFDEEAAGRVWLVTGPNMAGKSTFLRQNALIALLAQMGSFVPAKSAHIGVVDRLFSRVGASDDLARGRSTFMVEMVETAAILNQASARSLVILDEIGRGTATFDGLSIAWATIEYLHDVARARTLFATHYHELSALAERLAELSTVTMDVREWKDDIVFLHKVKAGAADRSYGIQVAKLAGMPEPVVRRAREVLAHLETEDLKGKTETAPLGDLPLFAAVAQQPTQPTPEDDALRCALAELVPDEMSPREALEALYRLKALTR